MTNKTENRQFILGAVLVGAVALTTMQTADAHPWAGGPGQGATSDDFGYGHCYQAGQLDEKTIAARDKFLSETVALRKEMAIKRAEQEALMKSENPDAKRIAQLTGEIFDLREQLQKKAAASGLEVTGMKGIGCGGCAGPGYGAKDGPRPSAPEKPE